jgi:TolB protein
MNRHRLIRPSAVALLAVGVLAACGSEDGPSTAPAGTTAAKPSELPPGRIAFRRWLDDAKTHGAIFTVRTDGAGERQLTNPESGADDYPDWSPDGRLIAYQHCADGEPCSVWTVDAAGGEPRQLHVHCRLKGDCDAASPAWTPDGQLVVTLAQGRVHTLGGQPQIQQSAIEQIDLRTGQQRTIHKRTGWAGDAMDPQVSPDGRTVIYTPLNSARSKPPFAKAIFALDGDGSHHHPVTSWDLGGGDHPVFSPDGLILFRSHEDDESRQSDFWTVRPDGAGLKQLTHFKEGALVTSASYSPDGAWIVYSSDGDGGADLHVMRADGTGQRVLTSTKWWDSAPDWQPTSR